MRKIHLGLLGYGTVGTGVVKILLENKDLIVSRVGAELVLKHVADIDVRRDRGIQLSAGVLVTDAQKVVDDPDIDIVIEMIGGTGIAKELVLRAIGKGKQLVTANKALLAIHGNSIFKAAAEKGVELAYEASVGGCIPIIKSLRESLVANHVTSMTGILNGTCNYILSQISDEKSTFETALSEAQQNGIAEADPTLDVEGIDTAHKLAILTALSNGMEINFKDIYIEGISKITPLDIEFAAQFGYRIKLLAIGKNRNNSIEARVHPTMIPFNHLLSNINGTLNAIALTGDAVGDILLCGHGAGMMPTASAVVGDIVDLARNLLCGGGRRVPLLSYQMENLRNLPILPIDDIFTHYYLRFSALDRPLVLSRISGILGNHHISIKSVQQKGRKTNGTVPLVMLTHRAKEADVKNALAEINCLDVVGDHPVLIRIEDENNQD
ncbi:MAG: homoserine dehydrogenase [Desulfobacterales bacterium]|nr:homoserine dehydrogenase [Desulfobacterales bacterium]